MNTNKRLTNWDLLRALSMFLVVVVHIAPQLGSFCGINAGAIVGTGAIICDPIFFCLSGYFALRPLKKSYKDYLFGKALSLLLPRTSVRIQGYNRLSYGHQLHQIHERLDSRWLVVCPGTHSVHFSSTGTVQNVRRPR